MQQPIQAYQKPETHGPAVTKLAVWFVILIPLLSLIMCRLGAWLMS